MAPDPEAMLSDDEEFVDAQEELTAGSEAEEDDEGSSETEAGPIGREHRGEDMDLDEEDAAEEADLFESTFGATNAADDSDEDERPSKRKEAIILDEHTNGCTTARGPPTPSEDSHYTSAAPPGPRPPNPHRDRSWNLRRLHRFYLRAKELTPRLPLASHRYWIGVLSEQKTTENFKLEKDFVWMKGNRITTVQTIWHMYQQSALTDGFVLLLGHEKVDFTDTVEELDYFGEKKVILRAVSEKHADAKGRMLTEGIVTKEVVPQVKKVQREVIVLDDEDEI